VISDQFLGAAVITINVDIEVQEACIAVTWILIQGLVKWTVLRKEEVGEG
jgi:hypothetical protein